MRVMRVNGAANNFTAVFSETFGVIAELNDLSGTDEGEIKRIEEEDQPFGFIIMETELFKFVCRGDP